MTSVLANIPVAILSAVLPVMASVQGDHKRVRSLLAKSCLGLAASSLILTLALFRFSTELVVFLFGQDYASSGEILGILAWSLPPIFVGMAFSNVLLSQRELIRFFPVVRGAAALVAVVASLLLIAEMEGYGAALASLTLEVGPCGPVYRGFGALSPDGIEVQGRTQLLRHPSRLKPHWLEGPARAAIRLSAPSQPS